MAVVPFGRWPSPLDAARVAAARRSRSGLASDGEHLYWLEGRPWEGGRTVLVRGAAGAGGPAVDVSPDGVSIRSRVHEYGGGAWCLVPRSGRPPAVAYVDQADQRIWLAPAGHAPGSRLKAPQAPRAVSAVPTAGTAWYHGDLRAAPGGRWVLAVREEHRAGTVARAVVAYAVVGGDGDAPGDADRGAGGDAGTGGEGTVLVSGRDFYAAPRPDPGGRRLAWLCWDHPDMPWDAAELWVGPLDLGPAPAVGPAELVAGGNVAGGGGQVSAGQPLWCADGSLAYVADPDGWWIPHRWRRTGEAPAALCGDEAEFHGPDWALGQATMAELPGGVLACRRRRAGTDAVVLVHPAGGVVEVLDQPCVSVVALCAHRGGAAWLGATPDEGTAAWWWSGRPAAPGAAGTGAAAATAPGRAAGAAARYGEPEPPLLPPGDVARARPFSLRGRSGRDVHGLYYAPVLAGVEGPAGTAPPLVVHCHGGPTGSADAGLDPVVQLLTTRGYAVAAVDYAGSTGYGRAYRDRLRGTWGEADVDDCVDAARHLVARGLADPSRLAARGSSAGGLTALGVLARSDHFAAAVSWYGVTDLLALAAATHDFEAHYTDRLIGPLPAAEAEYRRRSPVERVGDMHGAVLVLQGLDDPVVPAAQAEAMVAALRARGLTCRYLAFPGESHGFRRAGTLQASLEAELAFYATHLAGRDPAAGARGVSSRPPPGRAGG